MGIEGFGDAQNDSVNYDLLPKIWGSICSVLCLIADEQTPLPFM
jgi:hypothetical protein